MPSKERSPIPFFWAQAKQYSYFSKVKFHLSLKSFQVFLSSWNITLFAQDPLRTSNGSYENCRGFISSFQICHIVLFSDSFLIWYNFNLFFAQHNYWYKWKCRSWGQGGGNGGQFCQLLVSSKEWSEFCILILV